MLASIPQEIIIQVQRILNLIPIENKRRKWHSHKNEILTILKLGRKTCKDLHIGYATFYAAVGLPSQFDYTWRYDPAITKALKTWEEEQQKKPLTSPLVIPPISMRPLEDEDNFLPPIKLIFLLPKPAPNLFSPRVSRLDPSGIPSHNTSRPFAGRRDDTKPVVDHRAEISNRISEILAIKEIPPRSSKSEQPPNKSEQPPGKFGQQTKSEQQMTQTKSDRWIEIDDSGNIVVCKNKKVQISTTEEGYTVDEDTVVKISKKISKGSELYFSLLKRFSQVLPDDV